MGDLFYVLPKAKRHPPKNNCHLDEPSEERSVICFLLVDVWDILVTSVTYGLVGFLLVITRRNDAVPDWGGRFAIGETWQTKKARANTLTFLSLKPRVENFPLLTFNSPLRAIITHILRKISPFDCVFVIFGF